VNGECEFYILEKPLHGIGDVWHTVGCSRKPDGINRDDVDVTYPRTGDRYVVIASDVHRRMEVVMTLK
jgi:hypothetical protein